MLGRQLLFVISLTSLPCITLSSQSLQTTLATYGLHYGSINHISSISSFDQAVASGAQIFVKIGAPWCPPCQKMAPIISELASEFKSIVFIEVNLDSFKDLANRYGVRSIPAVLLFKNGSKITQTTGFKDKGSLVALLNNSFTI